MRRLPPGKLPPSLLARLLADTVRADPRVLVPPGVGEDAAVIDCGERLLVVTTDPITFATDSIGWYAVNVNANDVAAMGATPRWFFATVLLPPEIEEGAAEAILRQIGQACDELDITLAGGHTEITLGLDRPIVVGCLLGEVARDRLVTSAGARPEDIVLLTTGVAVEGTALLAREIPDRLRQAGVTEAEVQRARGLLFDPGLSVLRAARIAGEAARLHALHDPTEGGLITGLRELAQASGVGLRVDLAEGPVLPLCHKVCQALGLDPLGLIASGSLLMAVAPVDEPALRGALGRAGIAVYRVARVVPAGEGLVLVTPEGEVALPEFARDELARALEG